MGVNPLGLIAASVIVRWVFFLSVTSSTQGFDVIVDS